MTGRDAATAFGVLFVLATGCAGSEADESSRASGGAGGTGATGGIASGGTGNASSGSGGTSSGSGGSAGSASPNPEDVCGACADTKCAAEFSACEANPDCSALLGCLDSCSDEACATQCFSTHAAGQSGLNAVDACVSAQCQAECGGAADACDVCVESKCSAALGACTADPDCMAFWDCTNQCADEACWDQCAAQHPNGVQKSDAVDACVGQQCAAECGAG